jgi:hypothetical protein
VTFDCTRRESMNSVNRSTTSVFSDPAKPAILAMYAMLWLLRKAT